MTDPLAQVEPMVARLRTAKLLSQRNQYALQAEAADLIEALARIVSGPVVGPLKLEDCHTDEDLAYYWREEALAARAALRTASPVVAEPRPVWEDCASWCENVRFANRCTCGAMARSSAALKEWKSTSPGAQP